MEPVRIKPIPVQIRIQFLYFIFYFLDLLYQNKTSKSNRHCGKRLEPHTKVKVHNNKLNCNQSISVT